MSVPSSALWNSKVSLTSWPSLPIIHIKIATLSPSDFPEHVAARKYSIPRVQRRHISETLFGHVKSISPGPLISSSWICCLERAHFWHHVIYSFKDRTRSLNTRLSFLINQKLTHVVCRHTQILARAQHLTHILQDCWKNFWQNLYHNLSLYSQANYINYHVKWTSKQKSILYISVSKETTW